MNNASTKRFCQFCHLTGKEKFYTHSMTDCLFIRCEKEKGYAAKKPGECDSVESRMLQEQYQEYYRSIPSAPVKKVKKRKSVGPAGRLRMRKLINYSEDC